MSIAEPLVRRLQAVPNMRALAREADVAEKTLYRIRDANRDADGQFDYSPSVAIAEKIIAALDRLHPETRQAQDDTPAAAKAKPKPEAERATSHEPCRASMEVVRRVIAEPLLKRRLTDKRDGPNGGRGER